VSDVANGPRFNAIHFHPCKNFKFFKKVWREKIFYGPRSKIGGHIVFVLSVILSKTLTLSITFEWYVLGCWYFKWVFFVTRSFHGYQNVWLVTLTFYLLIKNFNLAYNFWMVCTKALIFHMSVPYGKTFHGYQTFWPCDLDLDVWHTY
jgi:hypothetical protein